MRLYLLVAIAGAIGATARWTIGELLAREAAEFPWATLLVNVIGCAAIGVAARHLARGSEVWSMVSTGLIGGLTTFSTFAAETRALLDADRSGVALAYVASSVVVGMAATELARGDWSRT